MQLNCSSKAINKHFSSAICKTLFGDLRALSPLCALTKMLSLSARQKTLLLSDQLAVLVCLSIYVCVCVSETMAGPTLGMINNRV